MSIFEAGEQPLEAIAKVTFGFPTEAVVLVGNGAVNNGWKPLRAALNKRIDADKTVHDAVTNLRKQNSDAFHQLALFSYKFKVDRALHFSNWIRKKRNENGRYGILDSNKVGLGSNLDSFIELRRSIATEFLENQNQLNLRSDENIDNILGKHPHFITTNWDNTLWNLNPKNLIHLHGRCAFSNSIVFPTDLVVEDTSFDFSVFTEEAIHLDLKFRTDLISTFRSDFIRALLVAYDLAGRWLQKANKIVIWGYSLEDYDADINALLATYTRSDYDNLELFVINIDHSAFERAIALTGITNATFYNPIKKSFLKLHVK